MGNQLFVGCFQELIIFMLLCALSIPLILVKKKKNQLNKKERAYTADQYNHSLALIKLR
jgi:hypothetical protein